MPRLYLCGAINGCTDAECKDWRATATAALSPHFTLAAPSRTAVTYDMRTPNVMEHIGTILERVMDTIAARRRAA